MQITKKLIASPINYTGGKYRLLSQLLPLFPEKIETFVDIFSGGCNVAINIVANEIMCNDLNAYVIGLLKYFQTISFENLKNDINNIIYNYGLSDSKKNGYKFYNCDSSVGLSKYNSDKFNKLKSDFNNLSINDNNYWLYLYVLIIFSFNNQMRFNLNGKFNLPVGKRDFNESMQNKLKLFIANINKLKFENNNFDFCDLSKLDNNSLIYADPPYLITCAEYNENNGWSEKQEIKLLDYLDFVNSKKIRFALSNVLSDNGKDNTILLKWLSNNKKYNCYHLKFSYRNSNYHKKKLDNKTDEVLITNY